MCNPFNSLRAPLGTLAVLLAALTAGQEDNKMTIMLSTPEERDYQPLELEAQPLAPMAAPATAPETPQKPEQAGYAARFANSERNGRVGAALPEGEWALAWEQEIRRGDLPRAVLAGGDRILVQTGVWQLFDGAGELIAEGNSGPGTIAMDVAEGRFYHPNRLGDLVARQLSDGTQVFAAMPFLGEEFERPLIRRYGRRLLIAGTERQLDPHGHHKATRSVLEWMDLGDPLEVSESGLLHSARNAGRLIFPTPALVAAASDDKVVAASPGRLYVTGLEPALEDIYGGEFTPAHLSLGGNGALYLMVHAGGEPQFWCVAMDGRMLQQFTMPEGAGPAIAPPVIGFDNRVFLIAMNRIIALAPDGALLWEWKPGQPVVGATCTADGTLVVCTQRELGLLDPEGDYRKLHRSVDSPFQTPPAVSAGGDIAVAAKGTLHVFRAR